MGTARMIPSFDNTKLYSQKDEAENARGVVIISHGLAEHLGRYDAITVSLLENGYSVYRYEQRGHARSEGKRTFFDDYNEMPNDLKTIVDLAKEENPDLPVYVIGHSMGGFTAALYATKYPGEVNGVVLSGALTRYNNGLFGPLPLDMDAEVYVDNELGEGVCSDPAVAEAYANDPMVEKKISIGLINVFPEGIQYLKDHAADLIDPILVLHGADDGLVAEKDSRDLYGDIGSKDKTLTIYGGLMHEIFNEPSKYDVYADVLSWLKKH